MLCIGSSVGYDARIDGRRGRRKFVRVQQSIKEIPSLSEMRWRLVVCWCFAIIAQEVRQLEELEECFVSVHQLSAICNNRWEDGTKKVYGMQQSFGEIPSLSETR